MLSVALADTVTVPVTVAPAAGAVTATVGGVESLRVTVSVAGRELPAASRAVTVMMFVPACSAIAPTDQLVVPAAVPLPPRLFVHLTCVTPTLSAAVPPSASEEPVATTVEAEVGEVMAIEGASVSAADPVPVAVTIPEIVSPFAVKLTVALAVVDVVGVKRTLTACVAPVPLSVKELPDTMLKGAPTAAAPVIVPPAVFDTVKVCSAKLPMPTLPKFTVPVGLTANSARAMADRKS